MEDLKERALRSGSLQSIETQFNLGDWERGLSIFQTGWKQTQSQTEQERNRERERERERKRKREREINLNGKTSFCKVNINIWSKKHDN